MLWLHTTARATPELGPLVFDFAGQASATQLSVVFLMGLQRHRIDRLQALGQAAGLRVICITSCGASLAAASAASAEPGLILLLRREGVELITHEHGDVRAVRHVGPVGAIRPMIAELRRTAIAMPRNPAAAAHGQTNSENSPPSLVVWDDVGADPQYLEAARQAVGGRLVSALPRWIGLGGFDPPEGNGLSAAALTLAARKNSAAAIDFLHPRLSPPVQPARPRTLWVTAAAVIVLLILGAVIDMTHLERQISRPQSQLEALRPQLDLARPFVASMQFAESFQTGRPRYLACLRDLTAALPAEGQMYFLDFTLATDMKGQVSGQTASDQNVLSFLDKVNAGGRFVDTNCRIYSREAHDARGGNEVSFTLMFTYVPPT
jgi:hypothetical protein